jgi:hypothetical protein
MIIIIFITIIILILISVKINESFIVPGTYAKPSININYSTKIPIPHNPKNGAYLNILKNINGYQYYVGGGLANSYYTYGFKPTQISKYINLDEYKFNFNHNRKIYEKSVILNKSKIVPLVSLCIKEINDITKQNIDKINELQDRMFKIDEKNKKNFAKKHLA